VWFYSKYVKFSLWFIGLSGMMYCPYTSVLACIAIMYLVTGTLRYICVLPTVQPPRQNISTSGLLLLGQSFLAVCELSVDRNRNLEESVGDLEMQWLGPNGEISMHIFIVDVAGVPKFWTVGAHRKKVFSAPHKHTSMPQIALQCH